MKCCALNCGSDSRHISKSQNITFHKFPKDPTLQASWLKAINREDLKPKDRSVVCSEHFNYEDFYETETGLRELKSGSVPILLEDSVEDSCSSKSLKACRICLAMGVKLFSIKTSELEEAYENLCGISLQDGERQAFPQSLCMECAHSLWKYQKFRSKSLRADLLMMEILKKHSMLTIRDIKKISRKNNQLTSQLSITHHTPHDYVYPEFEEVKINNEKCILENETRNTDSDDDNDKDYDALDQYSSSDDLSLSLAKSKTKTTTKKEKKKTKVIKNKKAIKNVGPKIDRRRKPFLNDDLNVNLFTITNLSYEEQIAEIMKRQDSSNYKNAIYKCTDCFKGFLDEDAYKSHVARHTTQSGEHACQICKTHFKHPHALRKHITAHHTQRFSCNQCIYVTTHRQTARLHERWHNGTKYSCPHCNHEFLKFTTYMGHIRMKHPSDFVCEICGYSFVSAKGIELHKKLKHRLDNTEIPEDGPFCELCNVRFVSVEAHRRHLTLSGKHNTESNNPKKERRTKENRDLESRPQEMEQECDDKKKMYRSQLRKARGPISCEQCGVELEDSRAYHGHFRRMHPDKNRTMYPSMKAPCMCEVCGRLFQSYALLKDHRWVHTGERPFSCEVCSKTFRMRQRLVTHRRVHTVTRSSYACSVCGKHFTTHSNRQRHMFIHTGLKPFKCEMCGKGFKHGTEKRAHITYVHLKKPWPKRARGKKRLETKQVQVPQQGESNEMDVSAPIWPQCDPKMGDVGDMIIFKL